MFYTSFNFSPLPHQQSQSHPREPVYSLTLSRRSWVGCNTWPCSPSGSESTLVVLKIPSQSTRLYTPLQLLCRTSSSAWWRGSNCRRCACPPPSARRWASLSSLRRTGCGRRLGRAAAAALPLLKKRSSTHLLAAFLLTWVARRPLPKQRRVVRRRARAPAGRNLVTRRRRRTRTRPQLRGTLVPTCSEWSRAAYSMPTHLQQQLGLVQSCPSSLTINSK